MRRREDSLAGWVLDVDGFGASARRDRGEWGGMPGGSERRTAVAAVMTGLVCAVIPPLASAGATAGPASAETLESTVCGPSAKPAVAQTALARELLDLVNAHRRSRGLRPVRTGAALQRSATWKARHMAGHGYVAHRDLHSRRTLSQRLGACGFAGTRWGEVLAAGQQRPRAALRAWLGSPPHRAVLEGRSWRAAGVGLARSQRGVRYWALNFGA